MSVPEKFKKATWAEALENLSLAEVPKNDEIEPHNVLSDFIDGLYTILYFYGSNDTGKTHTACGILNLYSNKFGFSCKYAVTSQYLNDFAANNFSLPESYKTPVIVCLDELGKTMTNSMTIPAMEALIKFRNENNLRTILVTNVSIKIMSESYGATIETEIREGRGFPLEFKVKKV